VDRKEWKNDKNGFRCLVLASLERHASSVSAGARARMAVKAMEYRQADVTDGESMITFGRNLESARRLNRLLHEFLPEKPVFWVNHFLAWQPFPSNRGLRLRRDGAARPPRLAAGRERAAFHRRVREQRFAGSLRLPGMGIKDGY
jgi:hypothetical protein